MKHPKRTLTLAEEQARMQDAARRSAARRNRKPQEARLSKLPKMDVELAVLYVAKLLEAKGRPQEAAALKLQLGDMLIRAALHKDEHPGPIALGMAMYAALRVNPRVSTKPPARPAAQLPRKIGRRGQD